MKRIVHLIPFDAIGGVEIAARSVCSGVNGDLHFERNYLVKKANFVLDPCDYHGPERSQNDPRVYFYALWRLYRKPPDLLVISLWRCSLILICLRILKPRTKLVTFLHSARDAHLVDKLLTRLALYLSSEIWADSLTTLQTRVPARLQRKGRIISFLLEKKSLPKLREPAPQFIFWGRLNKVKGLDRALKLFASIVRCRPDAKFTIIGPDGGIGDNLRTRVCELKLQDNVSFKGALSHADITKEAAQASFYLQTSLAEGMGISVVEAMQAGLLPVVTPVGEIARYCEDGKNAVCVFDDTTAVNTVLMLLADTDRYKQLAQAAAEYWQSKPIYRHDFLSAANRLIEEPTEN